MSECYDRQGNRISLIEWVSLRDLPGYYRIADTLLPDGRRVSTVWLGLDHSFFEGPPLIFETMVFAAEEREIVLASGRPVKIHDSLDMRRYSTEQQAIAGHNEIVAELLGPVTIDQLLDEC